MSTTKKDLLWLLFIITFVGATIYIGLMDFKGRNLVAPLAFIFICAIYFNPMRSKNII